MLLHLQVSQQRAHRTARAPHPAHATHTALGCTAGAHAHCIAQSVAGGQHELRVHSRYAAGGPRHHSPTSQGAEKHRPMCTASVARVHACDPIVQRGLCARMMASYHDQQLIPCVLIEIATLICASSYGQVILINAASASTTASTHACGATSSGGRVVSGSVRSCPGLPVALLPRPTHPRRMPRRLGFMVGCVVECECCLTDGMPSHRSCVARACVCCERTCQ